ncbi:MAG TPA: hemolysin family protein [Gemmatimonadaceae bacterium]|nr:hemolysin family protein [Gemmatimonadaceae bacterium]
MILRLLAAVLLVVLNAFFVAAESALVRARRPRLEARARGGSNSARWALRALADRTRLLAASQAGITLASLGLGWILANGIADLPMVADRSVTAIAVVVIVVLIVAYLHIMFGQFIPRIVALAQPERVATVLAAPLLVFAWLIYPFTLLLNRSSQPVTRRVGQTTVAEEAMHFPGELRQLVERAEAGGAIEPEDADLLEGVFEFSEKNAREVMTPRTEIVALSIDASFGDVIGLVNESGLSRFPVYEGSIDNIIGIVLAKDLLPGLGRDGGEQPFSLRHILRSAHFIPGTREVEEVLSDFKRLKEHMAIVLDEYGGTAGVVTMEDLLEEIVGEILDEHDEREEPAHARGGEVLVAGDLNIGELNERLGLAVPENEFATIGGYVFGTLGRVPRVGDRVTTGGATFTVRSVEGRRAEQIAVKRIEVA